MCRRPFDLPSDLPLPGAVVAMAVGCATCLAFGSESVVGVGLGSGGVGGGNGNDDDDGVERECFNCGIRTKLLLSVRSSIG